MPCLPLLPPAASFQWSAIATGDSGPASFAIGGKNFHLNGQPVVIR